MGTSSFFGKLFDLSFKEFITLQIVKYLYVIWIVFSAFMAILMLIGGYTQLSSDFGKGIFGILFSPVLFLLAILSVRLALEALVATFRIAENTTKLVEQGEHKSL